MGSPRRRDEGGFERQGQHGGDQESGQDFGQEYRADHADAGAEIGAGELAGGAAGKDQGKRDADGRQARTLAGEQKRHEGEKRHAHGAVDDADAEQQRECARKSRAFGPPGRLRLDRRLAAERTRREERDGKGGHQSGGAEDHDRRAPRHGHHHGCGERRHEHFADVAGKIVSADRLQRARAGIGARHERGSDRMLRAGTDAADQERDHEHGKAGARAGDAETDAGKRGAKRQYRRRPGTVGELAGRNLKSRHGAGEHRPQRADRCIGQPEFGLPYRQHDIENVGIAVMQRVRAGCDRERPPLRLRGGGVAGAVRGLVGHALRPARRSTKLMLEKVKTGSPR